MERSKQKITSKILALVLVFVVAVSMMPVLVGEVNADTTTLTTEIDLRNVTNDVDEMDTYGYYWDHTNKVLTLHNFNMNISSSRSVDGISLPSTNVIIKLIGSNNIYIDTTSQVSSPGIYKGSSGSLTVEGPGSLNIEGISSGSMGMDLRPSTLTINEATISIRSTKESIYTSSITVNGGTLNCNSSAAADGAVRTDSGTISINGGSMSATGGQYGLNCGGTITVSPGSIAVKGEESAYKQLPQNGLVLSDAYRYRTVENGTFKKVTSTNQATPYTIDLDQTYAEIRTINDEPSLTTRTSKLDLGNVSTDAGILKTDGYHWDHTNKILTLKNFNLNTTDNSGILLPYETMTINIQGTNNIQGSSNNFCAINKGASALTIQGSGILNLIGRGSSNVGISLDIGTPLTIDTAGSLNIHTKATGSTGIRSSSPVSVNNGKVNVLSGGTAFNGSEFNCNGGNIILKGNTKVFNNVPATFNLPETYKYRISETSEYTLNSEEAYVPNINQTYVDLRTSEGIETKTTPIDINDFDSDADYTETEGYKWDNDDRVLTLSDFDQTIDGNNTGIITDEEDTTIVLEGNNNKIQVNSDNSRSGGIFANSNLTIKGEGTLDIDTDSDAYKNHGIQVVDGKNLIFEKGNVNINGGKNGIISKGDVAIKGGKVKVNSIDAAAISCLNLTVSNGTLEANNYSGDEGVLACSDGINLSGGEMTLEGIESVFDSITTDLTLPANYKFKTNKDDEYTEYTGSNGYSLNSDDNYVSIITTEAKQVDPTPTTPDETQSTVPVNGTVISSGLLSYKVTNVKTNGSGTVSVNGFIKGKNTTKLSIPKSINYSGITFKVTAIANKAFKGNKKIKTVTIGNNVKTIGNSAFQNCTKVKKITIGTGLTKIGKSVFSKDKKLRTLIIKSKKLKKVGKSTLKGIKTLNIKVPKSKVKKYKKLFKNKGQKKSSKVKVIKK